MAFKNLSVLLVLTLVIASAAATREIAFEPGYNLAERLEASGGLVECWNALMEIRSCTNEILIYFLNGQADIGPDCCRAIGVITHHCWPAMLTSLGFTAEEGNILRGYCDASASSSDISPAAAAGPAAHYHLDN
ncbi:hypothetical protein Tsubulata_032079 [Turnera subulata]|uniref:Prolamin-like domain-containing protein n=1 Tax=Turnera subulata TaxID=218843 RepID=A0A9Q0FAU7_9ROSI|nr:hypothetical protein Tsubulata_032079 [Turnera subulata]